jgi:hypothetical protein
MMPRMKSRVLLVLAALVLFAPSVRADEPKEWPDFAKEKVGGVANGAAEADVVKAFGAAKQKTKVIQEGATGQWVSDWTFADGVSTTMVADKAKGPFQVRVIGVAAPSKLKTSQSIGLGSTLADIKKAYGKFLSDAGDSNWLVGTPYAGMSFHVDKDSKVATITFGVMAE